jgi:hypothetical protein
MPRAMPPTETEVVLVMKYTTLAKSGLASYSSTLLITPLDSRAWAVAPTLGLASGRVVPTVGPDGPQPVPCWLWNVASAWAPLADVVSSAATGRKACVPCDLVDAAWTCTSV